MNILDLEEEDVFQLSSPTKGGVMAEGKKVESKRSTPTRPMMSTIGHVPPGWVGNYRQTHDPNSERCMCASCTVREYPYLREGIPVQVHPSYSADTPQMQNMAGLYDKRVMNKMQVECCKCHMYIELEGAVADAYTPEKQDICHFGCLPDDERKHFESIGYSLPYVIFIRKMDGGKNGSGPVSETLPQKE